MAHAGRFCRGISRASSVFQEAERQGVKGLQVLNIGGGFPDERHEDQPLAQYFRDIRTCIRDYFPDSMIKSVGESSESRIKRRGREVRVIAEPGRFLVYSAFFLVTRITGKRVRTHPNGTRSLVSYFINDGMRGTLTRLRHHDVKVLDQLVMPTSEVPSSRQKHLSPSEVWGETFSSNDKPIGRAMQMQE